MSIYRPCYATREEVKRALDVKQSAYNKESIDRHMVMAAESIDDLCNRIFYPIDDTRYFDWPNYQSSLPWELWLDYNELAVSPATQLKTGNIVVPSTAYFLLPRNDGPPYNKIELDRSQSYSFGNSSTPQSDIALTGTFGYWFRTQSAGTLSAAVTDTTGTTVTVSNGVRPGVGDVIIVDSERMIVQDRSPADTGIAFSGLSTASASDRVVAVSSTTQFSSGETLLADDERLLVQDIVSGSLIVRRAWDGTPLSAHTSGTLWGLHSLTVARGQLGTAAATHSNAAAVSVTIVPGLVRQLAIAEAVVGLVQEPGAYSAGSSGSSTGGQRSEPTPGMGLADLRNRVQVSYGRKQRIRVV